MTKVQSSQKKDTRSQNLKIFLIYSVIIWTLCEIDNIFYQPVHNDTCIFWITACYDNLWSKALSKVYFNANLHKRVELELVFNAYAQICEYISRAINSFLFLSYSRLGCVDWNCESTRAGVESWRAYQLSLAAQPIIHQAKVLLSLQHGGIASTASSELPQNPLCRPIFTENTIFSWLNCVSKAISSYLNCPCFKFCFPIEFSYMG